ncbi:hypothetical protein HHK36_006769 [Tetracentron sinense]|uniref:Uncharacterized protein n=1 Tax=Tetracentron sinense TaxID=13715 RepID=A0A834ZIL7_TETSI|nr:hypothetical protein HHK36_006769 [Tetracentron sinense]
MESEVSTVEFEGKSDLDFSSWEDVGKFNGIVHDSAEDIDGNYVLVKGADIVSDDPIEKDLYTKCKCVVDCNHEIEESPIMVTEAVEAELHQLVVGEEKITTDSSADILESELVKRLHWGPPVVVVENEGYESSTGGDSHGADQGVEGIQSDDALDGQKKVDKRREDKFREHMRLARRQVDELIVASIIIIVKRPNQKRELHEKRATLNAIDPLESLLSRLKTAISIESIGCKIHYMEHMIEHETLPLKEEEKIIHKIKQLKHLREQLFPNIGGQDELQHALDQGESIEENFKVLQTEAITDAAKKNFLDEKDKFKELQAKLKAADEAAYMHLQSGRKELCEKIQCFWKLQGIKDDVKAAYAYVSAGDREVLQDRTRQRLIYLSIRRIDALRRVIPLAGSC